MLTKKEVREKWGTTAEPGLIEHAFRELWDYLYEADRVRSNPQDVSEARQPLRANQVAGVVDRCRRVAGE